jgi:large subunit ribosomal protein L10
MISIEEKKQKVDDLATELKSASGIYLANFIGINVEKLTELRASLKKDGAQMMVVKNTLIKRAFSSLKIMGLDDFLIGSTAVILADGEDPIIPAKIIADFHKKNKDLLLVKAVKIEEEIYDGSKIKELSAMPGKKELQAKIISIAMGPGANLIGLFNGPGSIIAGQIKSLMEKLENK